MNPTPQVIPSLREWHGGSGAFALTPTSRIVLDTATGGQLADTARVFAADLTLITGIRPADRQRQRGGAGRHLPLALYD